jgi:uncharacterized protein YwqG
MDKVATRTALQRARLSRLTPYIDTLVQPSIRLHTLPLEDAQAETALEPGTSKIGGVPDLPKGQVWPTWQGSPQSFVAQLQLADLHPYDINHSLPATGMLWFFYDAQQEVYGDDPQDADAWSVLYSSTDQNLQRARVPDTLPTRSRFRACTITVAQELTITQQPQLEIAGLRWSNRDQVRFDRVYAQFINARARNTKPPFHRMFGHPDTQQDDMRLQCQLLSNGLTDSDDPRALKLIQDVNDWQLLLQVDSDERIDMRWASMGMLYYWIKKNDLQARKFDQTWLVLQSE